MYYNINIIQYNNYNTTMLRSITTIRRMAIRHAGLHMYDQRDSEYVNGNDDNEKDVQ